MSQWFMARDTDGEQRLMRIRDFSLGSAPIMQIKAEQRRKGFIALDASGKLGVFHSTAHRTLLIDKVAEGPGILALSPRANRILIDSAGKLLPLTLDNPHPEVSGVRCGARSGTRVTTSPSTSGSPRRPTPISSPS